MPEKTEQKSDEQSTEKPLSLIENFDGEKLPLSSENIQVIWDNFCKTLSNVSVRVEATLNDCSIHLDEKQVVTKLHNQLQLEHYKEQIKPRWSNYLSQRIVDTNYTLNELIETHDTVETKPRFLTEKEKLDYLSEKNPAFMKLRQEFDLDFE